jgi:oxaloacetate decarboxylase alpha subunit
MAGLLKPYDCEELITRLKESVDVPIAMQCHATTGLSTATYQKAIDAGIDMLDTAISSMSQTYGHSATETFVSILEGTERDTGLDMLLLDDISAYFWEIRKKYAKFEGSLKGVDSRILIAQVPGGMLTNMENQLREQNAADKMDEVLKEIPRVREDLGFIPLVTPTSQIVGSQSVLNVLTGERYKSITKETAGVLKGEYGATAAPVNRELQQRVLDGSEPITCRPADLIDNELDKLTAELDEIAIAKSLSLAKDKIDDVLTYALFPQVGLKFLGNRNNPDAFEPAPGNEVEQESATTVASVQKSEKGAQSYSVRVDGKVYQVEVAESGALENIIPVGTQITPETTKDVSQSTGESLNAPLSGNIFKVLVKPGASVQQGDVVIIMEAMKMETEIRATSTGKVLSVDVNDGDTVQTGQALLTMG